MVQKLKLLELADAGLEEMRYFAGLISHEERCAEGKPDHWLAKDLLAHIAEWQLQSVAEFAGEKRLTPDVSGVEGGEDATNAVVFDYYRSAPWDDVIALVEQGYQKTREWIEQATEADLDRVHPQEGNNPRAIWRSIASDIYIHPMAHLNPEFVRRGAREHVLESMKVQERLVMALDDSDDWRSVTLYNLGCSWALLGEKQKALDLVEQGLRMAPRLIEWSKKDSDLANLHGAPEFEAMLARVTPSA